MAVFINSEKGVLEFPTTKQKLYFKVSPEIMDQKPIGGTGGTCSCNLLLIRELLKGCMRIEAFSMFCLHSVERVGRADESFCKL